MEPTASSETTTPAPKQASLRAIPTRSVPFFATMKKLQSVSASLVGRDTRPANEPVRLRAEASQAYPSTELAKATTDEHGRLTLEVSFLGLFGPSGALPQHYTQTIIDRLRHKDHALRDFLDLFNHRWLSLFYRAWEKHDYASAYQTAHSLQQEDAVTRILWCLIGLGTGGMRDRLRIEDKSLLYYAGLLADVRSRQSTLANILSDWFQIPVQVLQFQGQWLHIAVADQTCVQLVKLGARSNNQLGVDAVVGERVWNVENRFRIRIGPLSYQAFSQFSPLAERLAALHTLARIYVGPQLEFDVQAVVQRNQVPSTHLGNESAPSCLGWNSWLGDWPFDHDAQDAVFELPDSETIQGSA